MKTLHTVQEVVKTLGGRKAASELAGVTIRAVAEWRGQGFFPSKLYFLLNEALAPHGCVADVSLFSFAAPPITEGDQHETAA